MKYFLSIKGDLKLHFHFIHISIKHTMMKKSILRRMEFGRNVDPLDFFSEGTGTLLVVVEVVVVIDVVELLVVVVVVVVVVVGVTMPSVRVFDVSWPCARRGRTPHTE